MTPRSVDDLDLVLTELQRRSFRDRLSTRWMNLAADFDLPLLPGQQPPEFEVGDAIEKVASVLDWETHIRIDLLAKLEESGLRSGEVGAPARLTELAETARTLRNRARSRQIEAELDAVMSKLNSGMQHPDASPIWGELHDATTTRQLARWNAATSEARRLTGLSVDAARRNDLRRRFVDAAPLSAKQLGSSNGLLTCGLAAGWHWRQLEVWLDELDAGTEPSKLQEQLEQLSRDRRNVVTKLVAARAWDAMTRSIDDRKRQALNQFTEANRRLGKGTGKYGAVWKQEIRKALENAQDAVPVWIMPIHKVISTFRPTAEPPFDVVIIDEASQVGLLQLVVLGLAKRAIVVGDEKQTSPGNVGVHRQPLLDAMDQHLGGVADRYTRFNPDLSLYDIARQRFPDVVQLTEHFRCLPRIIEFSNHRWYDGSIVPLRDKPPHQGWESLGSVYVPTGTRTKGRDDNPQEARAVVDLIAELTSDTRYDGMTFGVITLFSGGQGALITQLLLDRFGPEFMERRQLRVSDPAGFQGDERDIIIYSLVVAPNEKTGAMTDEAAHRRINVAASRGVNQTWMVHSVRADAFRDDDPRRWLLEYATTPPVEDQLASNLDKADSDFERRVLRAIEAAGYRRVFAQYPVGRFSIDIVIEGPETRLAVECDGDRWHGPDKWADDYARQQILERAGWTFERIRGSAFYRNPSKALEPLWQRLKDLGIPKGDWDAPPPSTTMHRIWPQDFAADTNQTLRATRQRPADESEHSGIPESSEIPELPLNLFEAVDQTLPPSSANPGTNREIRRWARGAGYEVEDKGRIAPEILSAWLAAHPGRTLPDFYEPIDASATGTGALLIVPATNGEVRRWARSVGLSVGDRGRLHPDVINAWNDAFPSRPFPR
jgi:very-short-patch-repair endonuclease